MIEWYNEFKREAGHDLDKEICLILGIDPIVVYISSGNGGKSYHASTSEDGRWRTFEDLAEWLKERQERRLYKNSKIFKIEEYTRVSRDPYHALDIAEKNNIMYMKYKDKWLAGKPNFVESMQNSCLNIMTEWGDNYVMADTLPLAICGVILNEKK